MPKDMNISFFYSEASSQRDCQYQTSTEGNPAFKIKYSYLTLNNFLASQDKNTTPIFLAYLFIRKYSSFLGPPDGGDWGPRNDTDQLEFVTLGFNDWISIGFYLHLRCHWNQTNEGGLMQIIKNRFTYWQVHLSSYHNTTKYCLPLKQKTTLPFTIYFLNWVSSSPYQVAIATTNWSSCSSTCYQQQP